MDENIDKRTYAKYLYFHQNCIMISEGTNLKEKLHENLKNSKKVSL